MNETKWIQNRYESLRINNSRQYGGKKKLVDSAIYSVEIALFQILFLQKQIFRFARLAGISYWLHDQHARSHNVVT